jgi:5-methylcytosine-specific restriction endonuclease McrA
MKNSKLRRFPIKYIRDKAKSAYKKDTKCYVCGVSESLELHHVYSISKLFIRWCRVAGIVIDSLEDILQCREKFISEHHKELYDDVRTLCKTCHLRLHKLFSQHPPLQTAPKQLVWLDKLKAKLSEKLDDGRSKPKYV